VLSRAVSGDADKYQIAAAVVRARSAQDDCLEMLLGEMSELSREVRALRSEVEALRGGGGVAARASASPEVVRGATKTSDADDDERVVRQMMDALGATDDDARPSLPATKTTASSGRSPPPFPEEDFSDVPVAVDAAAWRGDGTDRSGEWPLCKQGEDDIYLMATMQSCLNDAGFWAGEEDEADFYFGPSTADALCYFQASAGLPETGVCDAETWGALLGAERHAWGPPPGAVGFEEAGDAAAPAAGDAAAPASLSAAAASAKAWSETAVTALVDDEDASASGREDLWGDEKSRNDIERREKSDPSGLKNAKKWPVLRPEDGGWETHKLQVLLDEQGYYSGEEDMEYWFFGITTENALGTFQASNGIPDTGLTCADTWRVLLGEARFAMDAKAALETVGDGEFPLDLSRQDRVFLLGENRFEDRKVDA
jgi:peptidoglycan hydrolase-like protein with peptidoglycan-binding domain